MPSSCCGASVRTAIGMPDFIGAGPEDYRGRTCWTVCNECGTACDETPELPPEQPPAPTNAQVAPLTLEVENARNRAALIAQQDADAPKLAQRIDAKALGVLVGAFDGLRVAMKEAKREMGFMCSDYDATLAALSAERAEHERTGDALVELVTVAGLRGDNDLPHPCDDPKLWTARMQDAWNAAEDRLKEVRERNG